MDAQALENNAGGLGLFGDDDEEENEHQQIQQQQYEDDLDADDILGLDDDAGAMENHEGSLLMRFCPHDSSMLYPKVRLHLMARGARASLAWSLDETTNSPPHSDTNRLDICHFSTLTTGKSCRAQTSLRMSSLPLYGISPRATNLSKHSQKRSWECVAHCPLGSK
jgi:hypothetical protein